MTVYVTQEPPPGVNILGAVEFGELVVLHPLKSNIFGCKDVVQNMQVQLKNFKDGDYILPMGDPAMIGIAASIAANNNEGRVRYLKWDRQEKMYYVWNTDIGWA